MFGDYFAIFPWDQLPPDAEGFDMACSSGRWARFVAPRGSCQERCHPLEQRFSRAQILAMCSAAGLVDLCFSPRAPYWCAVGLKLNHESTSNIVSPESFP